jgi:hypothetical protein
MQEVTCILKAIEVKVMESYSCRNSKNQDDTINGKCNSRLADDKWRLCRIFMGKFLGILSVGNREEDMRITLNWMCRSLLPRGLRARSAAAWLLGSRVRIPLRAWMFVCCVYMLFCPVWVEASATGWSLVQRSPIVLPVCVWSRNPGKGGQRSVLDYRRLWWMN